MGLTKWNRIHWLVATSLLLALVGAAVLRAGQASRVWAQVSNHFDLGWHVLSGGGGERASTNYQLDDVLGQGVDGRSASAAYQLDPGFWTAGRVAQTCTVYLPLAVGLD